MGLSLLTQRNKVTRQFINSPNVPRPVGCAFQPTSVVELEMDVALTDCASTILLAVNKRSKSIVVKERNEALWGRA